METFVFFLYFSMTTFESSDPLTGLVVRTLKKLSCNFKRGFQRVKNYFSTIAEEDDNFSGVYSAPVISNLFATGE